ncbi:Phosphatidate phosphatase APP1 [Apiospora arundinis]|uniref:Phosphatidate phosphatase APP1 n=1 Tax=Apiospora arundinis TaxID=335852 RepID=A0ABR2IF65_9PEZI
MSFVRTVVPLSALAALAMGAPAPEPVAMPHPMVTPPPILPRDFKPDTYVKSLIGGLGSDVSSYVASGIPQYFQDFPTGDKVKKSLGVDDDDLKALPTQVLNLPSYANWTDEGWNVRVHGNVYKLPNAKQDKIDSLANVFLIGTDIKDLAPNEQEQARNLTRSIYVVQQGHENVTIKFENDVSIRPNATGGVIAGKGGVQNITLPYETTVEGDFDTFVKLKNTTGANGGHLMAGNETNSIQSLNMYAEGTMSGNATAYLVPPKGLTIISDIDDILRITKIYVPKEGLLNSFARPFTSWMNMPEIYANWSSSIPDFHFHYLTTTPEQVTRNYMEFIYKTYPLGSFDTRPLNFSDVSATLQIRRFLLDKIFQTFPERKFILMGDTTNSDVMKAYPALAHDYPNQVQCIFLRNTTSTDDKDLFPYDTSGFEGIDQKKYMFFNVADELKGLDIVGGNCYNPSVKQNVTFGFQGRGFGNAAPKQSSTMTYALSFVMMVTMLNMML